MEIYEMNKVLALYDGYKEEEIQAEEWCGCNVYVEWPVTGEKDWIGANYDNNWSWLMPLWIKLKMMLRNSSRGDAKVYLATIIHEIREGNMGKSHQLIYEAIQWLNSKNTKA